MFSSSPFPELPLSPNSFLPSNLLFNYEKDCVFFNYNQSNGDCYFQSPSPVMENTVTQQKQFSEGQVLLQSCEDHYDLLDAVVSCSKSKKKPRASKKDGHGKIYTARGPRDRRVRMSIDISRKFFCLQDLLGFDKASKTLDWLFTKSKNATKELVDETNRCSSSTVNDRSKADFLESIMGDSDEDKETKKKLEMKCLDGKKKKVRPKSIAGFQENLAREKSRAMARARARERTREKMKTKKLNDKLKTVK